MPTFPRSNEEWRPTGALRARSTFFGLAVMEQEERRMVSYRQPGNGYSPGDWQEEKRWVRVRSRTMMWIYPPDEGPKTPPPAPGKV